MEWIEMESHENKTTLFVSVCLIELAAANKNIPAATR